MTVASRSPKRQFRFHISMQVRFRDVDSMNHVNHAVYFSYFEMARCEYWLSLFRLKNLQEINFIVVHAECDYRDPALYGEWIDVYAAITEIRNSSFVMKYEAWTRRPHRLVATGSTIQVLYDYAKNQTKTISPTIRRTIEIFEK